MYQFILSYINEGYLDSKYQAPRKQERKDEYLVARFFAREGGIK